LHIVFDWVLSVLGDIDTETVHTKLQLQRPSVRIRNPSTNEVLRTTNSNVPDLLTLHAGLLPSPIAVPQATLSVYYRRGQPFPGTPAFTFTIACEHGEVRLVAPSGPSLETAKDDEPVQIHVHWYEDDRVEEVTWEWTDAQKELPLMARSIWRTLETFADGKGEGEGWVALEDAARRAVLIEGFLSGWDAESKSGKE